MGGNRELEGHVLKKKDVGIIKKQLRSPKRKRVAEKKSYRTAVSKGDA